jgi:hypothetical protein
MAQVRYWWQALTNTGMNIRVPQQREFLYQLTDLISVEIGLALVNMVMNLRLLEPRS